MTTASWAQWLDRIGSGEDLGLEEAAAAFTEIMEGRATPAQVGALLMGLKTKGEANSEIAGALSAMRAAAVSVPIDPSGLVDVVGTGGDGANTFNISTAAAFVAAGGGARVAKHGNRSASSSVGTADVLEALGADIELPPEETAAIVEEVGFGFLFARAYHPAMRHVGPVRSEMGVRTLFNILGPMANPAGVKRYVVGVADRSLVDPMLLALVELGVDYAFVVHGSDGLDEITVTGPTLIGRYKEERVTHAEFTPSDFGVESAELDEIRGGTAEENAATIRSVLGGEKGARRDVVLVNASAALVAAGISEGFVDGVEDARKSIDSGAALDVLERFVEASGDG
ncbi:MAG: anthranilate phosphoribosyltransferase [Acidimicrobiia bacterium]|nr:anthranilate phosphoribosyltransferase [Acidimicrobiia bacterium]